MVISLLFAALACVGASPINDSPCAASSLLLNSSSSELFEEEVYLGALACLRGPVGADFEPFVRFQVLANLGSFYMSRGRLGAAEAVLREAVGGLNASLGLQGTLRAMDNLAHVLSDLAEGDSPTADAALFDEAEALLRASLSIAPAYADPDRHTRHNLGELLTRRDRWRGAEALFRQDLRAYAAADPGSAATARAASALAGLLLQLGREGEMEEVLSATPAARVEGALAGSHEREYREVSARADAAHGRHDFQAELALRTEAVAAAARIPALAPRGREARAKAATNFAFARSRTGAPPAELEPLFRDAAAAFLEFTELADPGALSAHNGLAMALEDLGRTEEALPLFEDILEASRAALGSGARETLSAAHNLGAALLALDRGDEEEEEGEGPRPARRAAALFREEVEGRRAFVGEDGGLLSLLASQSFLAGALMNLGELEEAEALLSGCAREAERLFKGARRGHPFAKECARLLKVVKRLRVEASAAPAAAAAAAARNEGL
jgi:hypothetical protein